LRSHFATNWMMLYRNSTASLYIVFWVMFWCFRSFDPVCATHKCDLKRASSTEFLVL
jgi:hypothetical protein